ncbi:MAG: large ribosomal subunit protein uL29 [Candidatus Bilamarchaeaceae archaeon]
MKMKDIRNLTPAEAGKKLEEVQKAYLELEPTSMKRKPLRKDVARLKTYLHQKQATATTAKGGEAKAEPAKKNNGPKGEKKAVNATKKEVKPKKR